MFSLLTIGSHLVQLLQMTMNTPAEAVRPNTGGGLLCARPSAPVRDDLSVFRQHPFQASGEWGWIVVQTRTNRFSM